MKTRTNIVVAILGLSSLATMSLIAGPNVDVQVTVPGPPVRVVAPAPPPPVVVVQPVPDTYVYDGVEYVGVVGSDYYYLGPDHVWIRFDAGRTARFHEWERHHGDWRSHTIHNENFRGHGDRDDHHDRDHDRH